MLLEAYHLLTLISSVNVDLTQGEMQVLFEQLRQKDAQILLAQKKLSHFRSWMDSLQSKVNAQNSQAVKNARRLYIGGFSPGSSEVRVILES